MRIDRTKLCSNATELDPGDVFTDSSDLIMMLLDDGQAVDLEDGQIFPPSQFGPEVKKLDAKLVLEP